MAINTSRAERRTDEALMVSQSTSDLVGPGSYEIKTTTKVRQESAVPFDSLQEKNLNQLSSAAKLTPGPGSYLSTELKDTVMGQDGLPARGISQTSFKSKAKRFAPVTPGSSVFLESSIAKNPGPGTYVDDQTSKEKEKPPVAPVKPVLEAQDKSLPSMPPMRFLPGREPETEAAKADIASLMARHTGEPRDMVGPGEYSPDAINLVSTTAPTTVLHPPSGKVRALWEQTVAIDSTQPDAAFPGPGSYDAQPQQEESSAKGAAHRFNSGVPLPHEQEIREEKVGPGPGHYDISGAIDVTSTSIKERAMALGPDRYRFGSMTERVGWQRDINQPYKDAYNVRNVPGPGHYSESTMFKDQTANEAEKALPGGRKKKFHGVHHPTIILALQEAEGPLQAFNSTDDRPCNKEQDQITPAPWQYNREASRGESMNSVLKEKAKVGRKGVFGTCADRFYGSPLNGREGLPDPSFDGGSAAMGGDQSGQPQIRSSFKSTAPRVSEGAGTGEISVTMVGKFETPAPGAYETTKEPSYRSPFRLPRQEHLSFGASKQRFSNDQDVFAEHQLPLSNPAPGSYDPKHVPRVPGAPKLKDKRRPLHYMGTAAGVGPGSYFQDGNGDAGMLKKTFNVTTQAPLSARPSKPVRGSNVSVGSFY
mmetsp:Transcript_76608/g.135157  ORF Transcript_76608/g.135157 Transcript_76608/m.135157 type:complete len:649 (+) Transcript_76608:139-2085(+)|eukprot:CAMPEP_0197655326 /NCGR_PEP_ID=MMETSP1338-20131121/39387_1 /TAXON_ID=43686 ORGANISM="Pelagodinium beii, Strain RCC1491" /NCGR_SAMPLE_ID=MMETSP1338 /ASSEMBLY_ACC=CAM_ASM_000754 /LENGTH=648 /DNA_ID=CAMNT_0043230953 /DNA_START=123 /DNA_END=2069 /DNA_ORIENTATION=-